MEIMESVPKRVALYKRLLLLRCHVNNRVTKKICPQRLILKEYCIPVVSQSRGESASQSIAQMNEPLSVAFLNTVKPYGSNDTEQESFLADPQSRTS